MATAKVILYTHKTLKDGSHPVNLQVVVNRRVIRKSLKMSCRLEDWDEENRTFKRSHPNYKHDSKVLSKFNAASYSRSACHEYARDVHNSRVMTERFLGLYEKILNGETLNATPPKLKPEYHTRKLEWD